MNRLTRRGLDGFQQLVQPRWHGRGAASLLFFRTSPEARGGRSPFVFCRSYSTRVCSMTIIHEIAPDLFRLSIYVPAIDMQFNHFLVRDDEPLLFHAGLKGMFPALREAVASLIDPAKLRHIAWSHFESDECGALNDWLSIAPEAQGVCTLVGKIVNADDFAIRPVRGMTADDVLCTGQYRYRFYRSPHIPHGWDAGVLFEETRRTLFCSDLFHHFGDVAATTTDDLTQPTRAAMQQMQGGPLAGYMPYTRQTEGVLRELAGLKPETLAVMHGSSFHGAGDRLLMGLAEVIREQFDPTE
jgi:flavorubredoxin